jgi:hypothetical protein
MPLAVARQEITKRLADANAFLTTTKALDPSPAPATIEFNIGKGLYIVILYAAFEYSISRIFSEVATAMTARKVCLDHIEPRIFPLALDAQLQSLEAAGQRRSWRSRVELFNVQFSSLSASVGEGAFLSELQNIWFRTLKHLFDVFGINISPISDIRNKQYIDTLVDKRNSVSHGRESAAAVGQSFTVRDLENYQRVISDEIQYISFQMELYLNEKHFIKQAHRSIY